MHSVSGSDSGHESMVHSQIGGRESLASSVGETISISAKLSNFKVSMAYESALHKKKCGLCQMYFERETVKYKVPNHRIFDLQNSWAEKRGEPMKREGRRYKSASFLYTETTVCLLCSQFFWLLNDELEDRLKGSKPNASESKGPKLDIVTDFERADISHNQRAYQSSDVDGKIAAYAVSPPFDMLSKTRREADPWWEVDFGRNYQLSKISFKITIHIRQEFSVYVMLLKRPVGFEDPFLDSISSAARETKLFHFVADDQKRQMTITWDLSTNASCFAIRVQLKGIHILELQQFQAFLGDEVILQTEEDAQISATSFATMNPKVINEGLKEMMSPQTKLSKLPKTQSPPRDKEKIIRVSESAVLDLTQRINSRYSLLGDWKSRVMDYCKIFNLEEIETLYKVVFKYTAETNKNNQDSDFDEHDLLGSALMEHYPRCDLQELHQRVRAVLRWIQSRSHLKILGALAHSEILSQISINSNEFLYKFMSAIKRIEIYWDKKEEYERMYAHLEDSSTGILPTKVRESRGCSWSQFLVVFSLFVQQRCDDIALHAFRINNPNVSLPGGTGEDLLSVQSYLTGDAMSVKSFDVSLPDHAKKHHQSMITSQSLIRLSTPARPLTSQSILRGKHSYDESILLNVRKDTGLVPFDSRMSEYKMGNLLRKMARSDIDFPPELDLRFAKGLIPSRDGDLGTHNFTEEEMMAKAAESHGDKHDDGNSHHSDGHCSSTLEFNGVPLPSRPAPLQRGITAKFQLIKSTSKLSKLLADNVVDLPAQSATPHGKKHAMFNLGSGKSSRNLLSSSAPSSNMLMAMHNQKSTRSILSDEDGSRPAPFLSRNASRAATIRDLNASAAGHNLTPVKEHDKHLNHSAQSLTKGNLLHTTSANKHLQRSPSSASILSNGGGDHRHPSPLRPATSFQLSSSAGGKVLSSSGQLSITHTEPPSPSKSTRRGSTSPAKVSHPAKADDESENADDMDFDADDGHKSRSNTQEMKSIDFHRICALCELRLPRASVEFKVMRKHVVKLKSSWDPKLVSKEVRQLDNTISMFNLVYVCCFCAQFFDPDFPDGIAYPKRVPAASVALLSENEETKLLHSITDNVKDTPLLPYYDVRYTANSVEVGEVFRRPQTKDSRKRANRAVEVAKMHHHHPVPSADSKLTSSSTNGRSPSPSMKP